LTVLQAIILGLVQGLTEFIPVSSSAHLIIVPWLFNWNRPAPELELAFDAALHIGTLIAVICYFRREWVAIINAFIASIRERRIGDDPNRLLAWLIIVGSIPGGIAGLALEKTIENAFHGAGVTPLLIMAVLIAALALLLAIAEATARHERPLKAITWRDGILIGIAQAAAIFPGVSRSGSTITAGLMLGFQREAAARFSFLLAGPIIAGAGLKKLYDIAKLYKQGHLPTGEMTCVVVGLIVAAVSGFFCIHYLLRFLQKHTTKPFIWYRIALAILIVAVVLIHYLNTH
jgi:undecaprenyl-diphosphatase